ncbi:MAG: hypothetical protein R3C12_15175 [Planctomycetaceae bacterium]
MEVMDPTGDWHLELKLEDRRMGHLLMAQQSGTALPVEYILATDPETSFKGTVKVGTRANPIPEKGNQVDVQVRLQVSDRQTAESSLPRCHRCELGQVSQNQLRREAAGIRVVWRCDRLFTKNLVAIGANVRVDVLVCLHHCPDVAGALNQSPGASGAKRNVCGAAARRNSKIARCGFACGPTRRASDGESGGMLWLSI